MSCNMLIINFNEKHSFCACGMNLNFWWRIAAGNGTDLPKHRNPVCLTWALKGSCSSMCKHKAMHVHYSRATDQKLNEFLDACGVAPQASWGGNSLLPAGSASAAPSPVLRGFFMWRHASHDCHVTFSVTWHCDVRLLIMMYYREPNSDKLRYQLR